MTNIVFTLLLLLSLLHRTTLHLGETHHLPSLSFVCVFTLTEACVCARVCVHVCACVWCSHSKLANRHVSPKKACVVTVQCDYESASRYLDSLFSVWLLYCVRVWVCVCVCVWAVSWPHNYIPLHFTFLLKHSKQSHCLSSFLRGPMLCLRAFSLSIYMCVCVCVRLVCRSSHLTRPSSWHTHSSSHSHATSDMIDVKPSWGHSRQFPPQTPVVISMLSSLLVFFFTSCLLFVQVVSYFLSVCSTL